MPDPVIKQIVVTIDGPSGAGKSTVSRLLAKRLGFTYLDTGAMYRAVGLYLTREGVDLKDQAALGRALAQIELRLAPRSDDDVLVLLNGEDVSRAIRSPEMGLIASQVSANPLVREKLTALQRQEGARGGVVAEGRDMGTVVFPEAQAKFFLDASAEERARRRLLQLEGQGETLDFEEILKQIRKRDHDDSVRSLAPLKAASDAIVVDCTGTDPDQVVALMLAHISQLPE